MDLIRPGLFWKMLGLIGFRHFLLGYDCRNNKWPHLPYLPEILYF